MKLEKIRKGNPKYKGIRFLKGFIYFVFILMLLVRLDDVFAIENEGPNLLLHNHNHLIEKAGLLQGRILDKDGQPLIGVTVRNMTQSIGVVSDMAG